MHQVGERVERVVDLVCDGGHQAAGSGQAFGAAQRFFEFVVQLANLLFGYLAFGDVADGAGNERPVFRGQWAEADLDRELAAIFAQAKEFQADAHGTHMRLGKKVAAMARVLSAIAFWNQHLDRVSHQFAAGVAEDLLRLRVYQRDLAVLVDNDHRVGSGFQQRAKLVFSLFSHSDIPYGAGYQQALGGLDGAETDLERKFASILTQSK